VPFAPAVFAALVLVTVAGALLIHWRHGALVRQALRRAGVIPVILILLAAPRAIHAQSRVDSLTDRHRMALQAAISTGDLSGIARQRQELSRLAAANPSNGLLLHYVGYAWYREATLGDTAQREQALDSAESALRRSERLVKLPETHAVLSTVIGQQIGRSPWKGMLYGSRVTGEMEKAVELDPENPRIALQQGINAFYSPEAFGGGHARARAAFERAIALFDRQRARPPYPDWGQAEAWAWLGRTRARAGDSSGARDAYTTALKMDSSYAWVSRVLLPALDRR
jgi:tetratricopeptide (TPR) repeat protein